MDKHGKPLNLLQLKTRNRKNLFSITSLKHIIMDLKSQTKESAVNEVLDIVASQGKLIDRSAALKDLLDREQAMSTAIPNRIAIPHAKTTGVSELTVAIGIKKSGYGGL
jgi:mannitol/fructose-specific phosphotransferase system IIA component (Ntr-type)